MNVESIPRPLLEQLHAEWHELHRYAFTIAWRCTRLEGGVVPPDHDDRVQEASAFAWLRFVRLRTEHPEYAPRLAIAFAVRTGAGRVRHGGRIAAPRRKPGPQTYRDAMAGKPIPLELDLPQQARWECWFAELVLQLPEELRLIAQSLGAGCDHETTRKLVGDTPSTYAAHLRWLRREVAAAVPELAAHPPVDPDELATVRPVRTQAPPVPTRCLHAIPDDSRPDADGAPRQPFALEWPTWVLELAGKLQAA